MSMYIVVVHLVVLSLANRFHVIVCLFSNRSQMTSKFGKNKRVATDECVTYKCSFVQFHWVSYKLLYKSGFVFLKNGSEKQQSKM